MFHPKNEINIKYKEYQFIIHKDIDILNEYIRDIFLPHQGTLYQRLLLLIMKINILLESLVHFWSTKYTIIIMEVWDLVRKIADLAI